MLPAKFYWADPRELKIFMRNWWPELFKSNSKQNLFELESFMIRTSLNIFLEKFSFHIGNCFMLRQFLLNLSLEVATEVDAGLKEFQNRYEPWNLNCSLSKGLKRCLFYKILIKLSIGLQIRPPRPQPPSNKSFIDVITKIYINRKNLQPACGT